jgi:uncharacterized OB-fold protein
VTAPYWEAARQGRLALQRCGACHEVLHPPAPVCPGCHSASLEWFDAIGRGEVFSWTVVRHAAHRAVEGSTPYIVALVTLPEGPLLICNILGCSPDDVRIGMPVRLAVGDTFAGEQLMQAYPIS